MPTTIPLPLPDGEILSARVREALPFPVRGGNLMLPFDEVPMAARAVGDLYPRLVSAAREYERRANARFALMGRTVERVLGEFELRPYQAQGAAFLAAGGCGILSLDPGLGKTVSSVVAIRALPDARRVIVVVPAAVKRQWCHELVRMGIEGPILQEGSKDFYRAVRIEKEPDALLLGAEGPGYEVRFRRLDEKELGEEHRWFAGRTPREVAYPAEYNWLVTNYELLDRLVEAKRVRGGIGVYWHLEKPDAVVLDECLPYETIVTTEIGPIPIGRLVERALPVRVLSRRSDGTHRYEEIERFISKRSDTDLIEIVCDNGTRLRCTPNHPVWTERGEARADALRAGDVLWGLPQTSPRLQAKERHHEEDKMLSSPNPNSSTTRPARELRITYGISNTDYGPLKEVRAASLLLGGGPGPSRRNGGNRSRWRLTQHEETEGRRQEERGSAQHIRMGRTKILELRSIGNAEAGDGTHRVVYNIEVANTHNYFANGILVSNCHLIKNVDARRARACIVAFNGVKYKFGLTGTPVINRPAELFNLLRFVAPQRFPSQADFERRYCSGRRKRIGDIIYDSVREDRLEELQLRLRTLLFRRTKEQVARDLPPKRRTFLDCPLPLRYRAEYDRAEDDLVNWLRAHGAIDRALSAGKSATFAKLTYLRQIVSAGKMKATLDFVDTAVHSGADKVILFSNFLPVARRAAQRFGEQCVLHTGEQTEPQRRRAAERFHKDDSVTVFAATLQTAGVGLNLECARLVVFNDLGWTPAEIRQGEDRAHRLSTTASVSSYIMYASETVDEHIIGLLRGKVEAINALLGDSPMAFEGVGVRWLLGNMMRRRGI